ncbi:undecaprenyl-phosphate galactose phosphotransferase [Flammeovirgaceae bacterium 311]|nr:undecaprenyl-phosphate galactose phosphotransferase [Flammeovirgaceae bacterium 311]
MRYYPHGKRLFDLLLCFLVLPLALPAVLLIAFISAFVFRQQVFYSHLRPGYKGQPFTFYKFSTLQPQEERNGIALTDGERQTGWGKFLRDYSLDELPQLFNILKGDMSWIGPRPLLMEYLPLYTPQESRRHLVKPGLTGLAQVKGRNEIGWYLKMYYDQQYVNNISFRLDIGILISTAVSVTGGQKINFGSKPQHASQTQSTETASSYLASEEMVI